MGKWEMVRLGDVCEKKIQILPAGFTDEIVYIDISSIDNNLKEIVSYQEINGKEAPSRAKQILEESDIIVSTVRPNLNAVAINNVNSRKKVVASTGYCVLRCKKDVDVKYVFKFCQTKTFIRSLVKFAKGASYPAVSNTDVKYVEIPLPPLDEQKRIAKNLDLASEIVKGYKEQLVEMEKLVQSVFYEMFGDPVTNEKGWEEREIGDIFEINPKKSELHLSKDMDVSFIPMQAVSAFGEIDLSVTKRFSEVEKGFTYFKENDVLFAKITPCMENGKGAVAKGLKNGIGVGSTEFHVLRGKNGYSEAIWLYYFTKLDVFREKAKSNMTGSAGQKRVPATYLAKYTLPVPPYPLQTRFASIVTDIEAQKAQIQQALTEAENLFNSLMQEYFE